jgi:hypothetical protein
VFCPAGNATGFGGWTRTNDHAVPGIAKLSFAIPGTDPLFLWAGEKGASTHPRPVNAMCGLWNRIHWGNAPYRPWFFTQQLFSMPHVKNKRLLAMGRQIRSLREAKGFSQDEFAHRAGLDRAYYGGIPAMRVIGALPRLCG